jgi:uncharacterized membrane-anchored protein
MTRLFRPSARQTNVLLVVGFGALGYAMYLRYLVIEQPSVALACDAGLNTWLCLARKVATGLFGHAVFGAAAVIAAVLNLIRPSIVLTAIGLAAAASGIVLYNAGLSALAAGLLILSLARRAPGAAPAQE